MITTTMRAITIEAQPPADAPMPPGIYLPRLFLVQSTTGEWHLAVWNGEGWHDDASGEPLTPMLVAELPMVDRKHPAEQ